MLQAVAVFAAVVLARLPSRYSAKKCGATRMPRGVVDPARAVEPQHLPGRGGGDHHIADVVDRGD
jgi:hypothetical protein